MKVSFFGKLRDSMVESVKPTVSTTVWLLKLMLPISFAINVAAHFGVIDWIAAWLDPLMRLAGLPGRAAVGFLTGAFVTTYAGIAAMLQLSLSLREGVIVSLMLCLCHALFVESAVNRKVGSSFWRMFVIRIAMAFVCAFLLNAVLPQDMPGSFAEGFSAVPGEGGWLWTWTVSSLKMSLMILLLIYVLMTVQRLIEHYGLMERLSRPLRPLMRFCGLPEDAAYMWIVGNVLGISYGSAVMLDLERQGKVTKDEANDVNYHLIMNHSLLEDTTVFASLGVPALLIVSTRLAFALAVVWSRRGLRRLRRLYVRGGDHGQGGSPGIGAGGGRASV